MHNLLFYTPIPCLVAVILVALAWGNRASGDGIYQAAQNGDLKKVKALLKANPNLALSKDSDTGFGSTALHYAAGNDHKDIVELLLANKADINARSDDDGATPLHWAVEGGYKDMVELLLAHKVDINAKANDGFTPLHEAALKGYKDVAEVLLAHGASVNAKTTDGVTPLREAEKDGHKDVAELLRQHGGQE